VSNGNGNRPEDQHGERRRWPWALLAVFVALLLAGGAAYVIGDDDNGNSDTVGKVPGVAVGNQDNQDPVFETVQSWSDLVAAVENEGAGWYQECLANRIGVSWEQAQHYANLVRSGEWDLRFILISNADNTSDEQARAALAAQGISNVEALPVVRVNGFENTRGIPEDRCQAFGDARAQVRVSLGIPVDPNDPSKGMDPTRGVLANCSNPWKLLPPSGEQKPPPGPSGKPTPPPPGCPNCGPPPPPPPPPPPGKCDDQTGPFCRQPHSLPETQPGTDTHGHTADPPPDNPAPPGAPPQQPGPGGVPINPGGPATPPTSSPPTGDPGGL
jgi:hypothetical protein